MHLMLCIDDDFGMLFNRRRQSQDRLLRERILEIVSGKTLWMNAYSHKQFANEDTKTDIRWDENFLSATPDGDYCFVETEDIAPYEARIETLTIFKWNRRYPSDLKLTIDLSGWKLQTTNEFPGSSHEKITEEVYTR